MLFEPYYDFYLPIIERAGGVPSLVRLEPPDWRLPRRALEAAFSSKTKLLVVNSPMDPLGKVFDELNSFVVRLLEEYDAYAVCDEVYEHVTTGGPPPLRSLSGMRGASAHGRLVDLFRHGLEGGVVTRRR